MEIRNSLILFQAKQKMDGEEETKENLLQARAD